VKTINNDHSDEDNLKEKSDNSDSETNSYRLQVSSTSSDASIIFSDEELKTIKETDHFSVEET